jgi:hypothetical protein
MRRARARADDPVALLSLILRGVRQRAFVIFKPNQIPRIEITAARLASEEMFGVGDPLPIGALAPGPSRAVSVHRFS